MHDALVACISAMIISNHILEGIAVLSWLQYLLVLLAVATGSLLAVETYHREETPAKM